jgi:hypothetical protein
MQDEAMNVLVVVESLKKRKRKIVFTIKSITKKQKKTKKNKEKDRHEFLLTLSIE